MPRLDVDVVPDEDDVALPARRGRRGAACRGVAPTCGLSSTPPRPYRSTFRGPKTPRSSQTSFRSSEAESTTEEDHK